MGKTLCQKRPDAYFTQIIQYLFSNKYQKKCITPNLNTSVFS